MLDAQLQAGNRHSPSYGRAGLKALIESLPANERPRLVRGDSDYGSEGEMLQLEELKQTYLFRSYVKRQRSNNSSNANGSVRTRAPWGKAGRAAKTSCV